MSFSNAAAVDTAFAAGYSDGHTPRLDADPATVLVHLDEPKPQTIG